MIRDVNKYVQARVDEANAAKSDQELIDLWSSLRDLYDRKLWHQVAAVLDKLVRRPEMAGKLMDLYENVIADFETK